MTKQQLAKVRKAGLDPSEYVLLKSEGNEMLLVNKITYISKWIFV